MFLLTVISLWLATYFDSNAYILFRTTGDSAHKAGSSKSYNGVISNVNITGNIMRFACDTYSLSQRYDYLRGATICVTKGAWYDITNMKIEKNIFDCTKVSYFMWTWGELDSSVTGNATAPKGTTIRNNTYYQCTGAVDDRISVFGNVTGETFRFAGCQDMLDTAVADFDSSPTKVQWVNRADKY